MREEFIIKPLIFLLAASFAVSANLFLSSSNFLLFIISAVVLFIIIIFRIYLKNYLGILKNVVSQDILLFALTFVIMLGVVSTGGFFSPFFVAIYIAAIMFALLFSLRIALSFFEATTMGLLAHLYYLNHITIQFDTTSIMIQIASIAGLVLLSSYVSTRYHLKGKIAEYLSDEISYSKHKEEQLLENIEEGVIGLSPELTIIHINKVAQDLSGISDVDAAGKDFFEIFTFRDKAGNTISKDQFPINNLLAKQSSFRETTLSIRSNNGAFFDIDFKFSSIMAVGAYIEGFLFVFNEREQESMSEEKNLLLKNSLDLFYNNFAVLSGMMDKLKSLSGNPSKKKELEALNLNKNAKKMLHSLHSLIMFYKLGAGEVPGLLTTVDVGEVVREVFREADDLAKEYGVTPVGGNPYSPPLPIRTNKYIFKEAVGKVVELAIYIASLNAKKFIIVSTGSSKEYIFIFVKATCDFPIPWKEMDNIFEPHFGELRGNPMLAEAGGLEGYLAKNLLKEKNFNGELKLGSYFDEQYGNQIVFSMAIPVVNA